MAYIEPLVMVYQEYSSLSTTTSTATLPACIIGPCYNIIDPIEDSALAYIGPFTGSVSDANFPNNVAGAIIDPDTVQFYFKEPVVRIYGSASTTAPLKVCATVSDNVLSFSTTEFAKISSAVKVGDYITLTGLTADTSITTTTVSDEDSWTTPTDDGMIYRVYKVDSTNKTITVTYSVKNAALASITGVSFFLDRLEDSFSLTYAEAISGGYMTSSDLDVDNEEFSLTGVKKTVKTYNTAGAVTATNSYDVVKAYLYVGYSSLRQDLSEVGTVYSVTEIQGKLGKIVPENPLAYGVNIALANTTVGVHFVGVDSDDLAGYNQALDYLENYSPVYALVPLTFSKGILTAFKNHAEQMSEAEVGEWRLAIGCTEMPTRSEVMSGTGTVTKLDSVFRVLNDRTATFLSGDVDAGDILVLTKLDSDGNATGSSYEFEVAEASSDDVLKIASSTTDYSTKITNLINDSSFSGTEISVSYVVYKTLDKAGKASAIASSSTAYGSRRFVNVWPDVCVIDGEERPGYYLCCAVAGAISGLQPHYGMTRLSISGIDAVKHSSDYFNREQLNVIADGGTFIFVQLTPSAAPYIRHQLTTDRSAVEFQEVSFVKNFDYVSYICKDVLDQYIGKWNIISETMEAIRTALTGTLENLKLDKSPKIGSPIVDFQVGDIYQSESVKDRIEAIVNVTFPYPLNTLALHLVSE